MGSKRTRSADKAMSTEKRPSPSALPPGHSWPSLFAKMMLERDQMLFLVTEKNQLIGQLRAWISEATEMKASTDARLRALEEAVYSLIWQDDSGPAYNKLCELVPQRANSNDHLQVAPAA